VTSYISMIGKFSPVDWN